jgi:hypothetical protein
MSSETALPYYAYVLRVIADRTGAAPLKQVALQPGLQAAYRISVHYYDKRACDSVATLCRFTSEDSRTLEVRYVGAFHEKPLFHQIELERYEAFMRSLQKIRFDHLTDQPGLPAHGIDLWLVERAAGSYSKSIILSPKYAAGAYAVIVDTVKTHLPEALRAVR